MFRKKLEFKILALVATLMLVEALVIGSTLILLQGKGIVAVWIAVAASAFGIIMLSLALLFVLRRIVIAPIKKVVLAAELLAGGDLSFAVDVKSTDEIGRMAANIRDSVTRIAVIIERIKDVADRVYRVTDLVQQESRLVIEGTGLETEAISNISSSIEQLNTSMASIAESVDSLSTIAGDTASAAAEMAAATEEVAKKTHEVYSAVDSTSISIEEMSSTINEVAGASEELSVSAEETLTAMEEIGASIKEVERHAKDSVTLSTEVTDAASGSGMISMKKTIEGMGRIKESVLNTSEHIKKLGSRSEDIGKILNVIDEVTDQTTLLALNAAILAAQAGEHGRGFSVVAGQIKNLAERTANSTHEIGALIESVQADVKGAVAYIGDVTKRVDEGIQLSGESMQALDCIVDASSRSSEMVFTIEKATAEQAKGVQVVNVAMENISNQIDHITKATKEQKEGARLITESAEKMRELTLQVEKATVEQSSSSRQISGAVETVSDRIHQISRAVREQKVGSGQIMTSIEQIKHIPEKNRTMAFSMNKGLRDVMRDNELLETEVAKFKTVHAGKDAGIGVIRMGVVPLESPAEMYRKFSPLAAYLNRRLGKRIDLRIPVNFKGAINDLGSGATQICYLTPTTYIEAHEKYSVDILVKALRKGKPFHYTVIIARDDSSIEELKDLKGKSFAFGDVHSTSSHLVPRAMLLEAGVQLDALKYYDYLGHHDDVAAAVVNGDFEAGGVMESVAVKYQAEGLKFIKYSHEIPEFSICVSSECPLDERVALKNALLSLDVEKTKDHDVLSSISEDYTGFVSAEDRDYDDIRNIRRKLGLQSLSEG